MSSPKFYKKYKYIFQYLIFLGIIFLAINSCDQTPVESPEDRSIRVTAVVEQKLMERQQQKMKDCKQNALIIAEKRVDSILLADAKLIKVDTANKPVIPIKPEIPEILVPKDSTPVEPLFEEIPDSILGKKEQ